MTAQPTTVWLRKTGSGFANIADTWAVADGADDWTDEPDSGDYRPARYVLPYGLVVDPRRIIRNEAGEACDIIDGYDGQPRLLAGWRGIDATHRLRAAE